MNEIKSMLNNIFLDTQEIRKLMLNGITIINRDNIYTSEKEINYFLELETAVINKERVNDEVDLKNNIIMAQYSPVQGIKVLENPKMIMGKNNNKKYINIKYNKQVKDPLNGNFKTKEVDVETLKDLMSVVNNTKNVQYVILCSDIEDLLNAESWNYIKTLVANEQASFVFLTTQLNKFPSYITQSAYITNYNRLFGNWKTNQLKGINSFDIISEQVGIKKTDAWYDKIVNQLIHVNSDTLKNLTRQLEVYNKDISIVPEIDNIQGYGFQVIKNNKVVKPITEESFKKVIDNFLFDYWKNISILSNLDYDNNNNVYIEDLGGYNRLKQDTNVWKSIFAHTDIATLTNTPIPKTILLQGPQGTGKTTIAKAIANQINSKFIGFNIANQFSSLLGETENNIKNTLLTLEKMAPAVVLIDEADKVLVGKNGSGQSDSGTTSRALQHLSGFMAEDHPGIFFVLTANDATKIPPEFLRAGRMDEIYFIDLPDAKIRRSILDIHMKKLGYNQLSIDTYLKANGNIFDKLTELMTGSEIENALKKAKMKHFDQLIKKDITNIKTKIVEDLPNKIFEKILETTTPIAKTCKDEIDKLVAWGNAFAINANE